MRSRPGWQATRFERLPEYFVVRQKPLWESRLEKSHMGRRFRVRVVVARLVLLFEDIPRTGEATADMSSLAKWKETT
jgi:hypothetical protein